MKRDLLAYVLDLSRRMAETRALIPLLSYVMDEVIKLVGAERGYIVLPRPDGSLDFKISQDQDGKTLEQDADQISKSILNRVIDSGQPLVLRDAMDHRRFKKAASVISLRLRSVMCVPLISRGATIGAIYVENRSIRGRFSDDDAPPLILLANQAAVAIENAALNEELEARVAARTLELEASRDKYAELYDFAPVGFLTLDENDLVVEANLAAAGLFGMEKDLLLQEPLTALMTRDGRDQFDAHHQRVTETRTRQACEVELVKKDGTPFDAQLESIVVQAGEGTFGGRLRTAIMDISERVRAEEELKEYAERLEEMVEDRTIQLRDAQERLVRREKLAVLGQLAGGVGHELRNPLAVISSAVYYLKMIHSDGDETAIEYLDMISAEVHNSNRIISDLLDFARTRPAAREEISVSALIHEAIVKHPAPPSVQVVTDIPARLPSLHVDPTQIALVLNNLITNAYQAMPDGGNLTISARAGKTQVVIAITDTGSGISAGNMEKLFEPLFTTKPRGVGLGLATSRNLAEVNGGSIDVESTVGEGATFTVRLPLDTPLA